jgi:hypothetical protein
MSSVTDVVSQLGGLADWRIGGGADSRNTERPPSQDRCDGLAKDGMEKQ